VYNSLQQTHLPKLADKGIIDYTPGTGLAELTERAERLDVYLEVVPERHIPWSIYYLGFGVSSLALTVALWTDAVLLSRLPALGWLTFISVALVFSAAVNVYDQRNSLLGKHERPPELRNGG
jgi:hypothetical protein